MAKRADIENQIKALQAELEGADTDDEIWIQEDGKPAVKVTGKRATAFLNRHAGLWDEPSGQDEDGDEDEGEPEDDPAPGGGGYFKGKGKAR